MRTQVAIVGGGPSGLLLSQLLHLSGIESVVLERRSRAHVMGRIRAGVLEPGTARLLRRAGVGDRMDREGHPHGGTHLSVRNQGFRVDFEALVSEQVIVYGQTEVTKDLYAARDAHEGTIIDEVEGVTLHDAGGETPHVTWVKDGTEHRLDCDWIAGCDGFHGVSRRSIPASVLTEYERVYPFGWLGILSETPPVAEELIYANHARGFALCSMRNANLSRYYLQVPNTDTADAWSDDAFWSELRKRIPSAAAEVLQTGPSIEKSIAPLRSFVAEPMRWGRLCLVGDAAHIVPPTGAKGLNLAMSDVHYLHEALRHWYEGDRAAIDGYSARALSRVWKATRFSWWFTTLMHRFPDQHPFDQHLREAELDLLATSPRAQAAFAENYVGLPL
ncbi:4-hydroxybenzoate 3-monooxygenase [Pelagovum pacificum]|uniref:4-hydroxybenzoate 3-monooxygenase n=1 Tax=Pelagovum pacificum TaxID=2588711 RepID=A0A5C5GBK3_9RHOB|nr:4-hydroxybenzoate 3-monooxygenase [Pelagovum pacificum]QQA41690.1 4-hydroxybenzoate 3-monooxygenase [Pelagovum pacificum]TNY30967.1 4-hydroxybenzoate 3-monooxygenase [Pelagovum pacificum]